MASPAIIDGMFNDEWIHEDQFQGWLVKVNNDERRAYCRFCAIVLQARKSELSAHARTQTHIASTKIAQESGVPTGPISVQIVCNEEETEDFPQPGEEEEVGGEEPEYKPEFAPARRTPQKRTSGKNYIKKYRPAWEEEEEFREWLQGYPEDVQRAFCKACKAILRAHKHDLTCHARTTRHLKKIQEYKAEQGGDQLFHMIAENVVTMPQTNLKRALEEAANSSREISEIGIEIDASGIFPDNGNIVAGPSDGIKPKTIIKMSKASLKQREPPKLIPRKRIRFTASDVISAIENNEFTGYELLQIVKKAVPKL